MNHHVAEEEKEHTHALIIGNGFDLEHGLKTDYLSFLKYLEEKNKSREKKESESNLWYGHFLHLLHLLELNRSEKALWSGLEQEIGEAIVELNRLFEELKEKLPTNIDVPVNGEDFYGPLRWGLFVDMDDGRKKLFEELKEKWQLSINSNMKEEKFRILNKLCCEKLCRLYKEYFIERFNEIKSQLYLNRTGQVLVDVKVELEQLKKDLIKWSFYDFLCVSKKLVEYVKKEYGKVEKVKREEKSELQKVCKGKIKLMVLDFNYTRIFERSYVPERDQLKLKEGKFKLDRVLSDVNLSGPIKVCYIHGNTISKAERNRDYFNYGVLTKDLFNDTIKSDEIPDAAIVFGCLAFKEEDNIDKLFNCYTKPNQREIEEETKKKEMQGGGTHCFDVIVGERKFPQYYRQCSVGENYETITYKDFSNELEKCQNITFHIIGHSLGEIDHDILREVLGFQNSRIRVYYHNKEAHCRLKKNIIKIIGKEDVKKRVEFIYQYDPQEGVFCEKK
ncbi:MAG: hypothetical protein J6P38_04445 [Acetobacter sp.]|nr:hypothetical protein [Acetobacter sp.]